MLFVVMVIDETTVTVHVKSIQFVLTIRVRHMHLIMRIQPCVVSPEFIVSAFLLSETLKNV